MYETVPCTPAVWVHHPDPAELVWDTPGVPRRCALGCVYQGRAAASAASLGGVTAGTHRSCPRQKAWGHPRLSPPSAAPLPMLQPSFTHVVNELLDHSIPLPLLILRPVFPVLHQPDLVGEAQDDGQLLQEVDAVALKAVVPKQSRVGLTEHDKGLFLHTGRQKAPVKGELWSHKVQAPQAGLALGHVGID